MNFIYWILVALTFVINASSGNLVPGKIHPPRVRRESGRNLQSPYLLKHAQIGLEVPKGRQSDRFARRAIMKVKVKQETETVITAPPPPKPGMMGSDEADSSSYWTNLNSQCVYIQIILL
ncbi:unnamed protein product [Allacma fusca]|uniref:Uncharacterized protein n=1 Tax=Allacma fusca TaxID=39272 RepID=A0A8J2K910_9HEXA|nr:unnamed protein product [Allacma fusca]